MTDYEKAVALWQQKNITTDAALSEALNGHSISFAYHSGRMENEKKEQTWAKQIARADRIKE